MSIGTAEKFIFWEDESGSLPSCLIFPARKKHTATVFFLHGLGDAAKNIALALDDLTQHPELSHVKFMLPTAPIMPITCMNKKKIPSWFDCYSLDHLNRAEDERGYYQSVGWINEFIMKEEKEHGIPSDRIVIGGLSQGGSVAILAALTTERPLGGLYALSTYVPLRHQVPELATPFSKKIPILWCHGSADRQVAYGAWKSISRRLTEHLDIPFFATTADPKKRWTCEDVEKQAEDPATPVVSLQHRTYQGLEHWINKDELQDVGVWISVRVPDLDVEGQRAEGGSV